MMGDKKEKIGIIIPALNSSAEINLTLLSLKETNKVFDVDLLLVDGGSVDNKSIHKFKLIKELDGFLIGGASKFFKNALW